MGRIAALLLAPLAILASTSAPALAGPSPSAELARRGATLAFEPNRGQSHPDVRYLARHAGYTVYATSEGVVLDLRRLAGDDRAGGPLRGGTRNGGMVHRAVVRLSLVGRAGGAALEPGAPLPGIRNYFIGDDPAQWVTDVPTFSLLRDREAYPGVDVVYRGQSGQLVMALEISTGARTDQVRLRLTGADRVRIGRGGEVGLDTAAGPVSLAAPVGIQEIGGRTLQVPGRYVRLGDDTVGLRLARYDTRHPVRVVQVALLGSVAAAPLINEPVNPQPVPLARWSADASIGQVGLGLDIGHGVAVDATGSVYVAGQTNGPRYPMVGTIFTPTPTDQHTWAVVTKLSPDLRTLVYSTYVGGAQNTGSWGTAIAVDSDGQAYVAGGSSWGFPVVPAGGAVQTGNVLSGDAFVAKLSAAGNALVYASALGGNGWDEALGIAVDASRSAYVVGLTRSTGLNGRSTSFATRVATPTREIRGTAPPDPAGSQEDGWVAKVNPGGTALRYLTFLGGSSADYVAGVAVDAFGRAHLVGQTRSADFPVRNAARPALGGGRDAFAAQLDASGGALDWATFLGGSGSDEGWGVAVDAGGFTLVAGHTASADFQPLQSAAQPALAGSADAFLTRLAPDGRVAFSTYYGGTRTDGANAVAAGPLCAIAIAGETSSVSLPGATTALHGGQTSDAFITRFSAAGARGFALHIGGVNSDDAAGVALWRDRAYIAGSTYATSSFPRVQFGSVGEQEILVAGDAPNAVTAQGEIEFTAGTYVASEAAGIGIVAIQRTGIAVAPLTVVLTTLPGSATVMADYAHVDMAVTFLAGERVKSVGIPIVRDAFAEPDETVGVSLRTPECNARLGPRSTATLVIQDSATPQQ